MTLLPLLDTPVWWVRAMDFPRLQIAGLLALVLPAAIWRGDLLGWCLAAVALATLAWQISFILPYTPIVPKEMRLAGPDPQGDDVSFMAANVLMENDDHAALRDEILRADADVVLLMETDATWCDALAPVLARYPTILEAPLDNHYGMILATRLKVNDARMVQLTTDVTPTAFAELVSPRGTTFRFVGLHPVPPVPGEDTAARDAQVLYAARYAHNTDKPVVAMGDFNTVAWSRTARRFRRAGGYLDPRVGRGLLPSFDTRSRILRFPIDQFYVKGAAALVSYERGPDVGSDHFPMRAVVRFDAALAGVLNRRVAPLGDDEEALIRQRIDDHVKRLEAAAAERDADKAAS